MMIVGLWTRWAALANIPVMLVALLLFHIDQGFFMTAVVANAAAGQARVVGIEYPLLVLAATVALVLLGGGGARDDRRRPGNPLSRSRGELPHRSTRPGQPHPVLA